MNSDDDKRMIKTVRFWAKENGYDYVCFTDGGCKMGSKYNVGGYGTLIIPTETRKKIVTFSKYDISDVSHKVTNNTMELRSIKEFISYIDKLNVYNKKVCIISDSMYCVKSFTEYIHKWKVNNWCKSNKKPILNKELIQSMDDISGNLGIKGITIVYYHVSAHVKDGDAFNKCNNYVDRLASEKINEGINSI